MIWNHINMYEEVRCDYTKQFFSRYKKAFWTWYKKQDEESLRNWKREGHADHLWIYKEEMGKFKNYNEYAKKTADQHLEWWIQDVERFLLLCNHRKVKVEIDFTDKCKMSNLVSVALRVDDRIKRMEQLQSWDSPDILIELEAECLAAIARGLETWNSSDDQIRILRSLMGEYEKIEIPVPDSKHSKTIKRYKNFLNLIETKKKNIERLYNFLLNSGSSNEDIYKKSQRLPGSGFSR